MNVRKTFGINKAITGPKGNAVQAGADYIRRQPQTMPTWGTSVQEQVANLPTGGEVTPTFKPATEDNLTIDEKMDKAIEVFKAITGGGGGGSGGSGGGKIQFEGGSKMLSGQGVINPSKAPKLLPAALEYDVGTQAGTAKV